MPEIGTYGSMSGDGKRGDAAWPKLPRPSSTLPLLPFPTRAEIGEAPSAPASFGTNLPPRILARHTIAYVAVSIHVECAPASKSRTRRSVAAYTS